MGWDQRIGAVGAGHKDDERAEEPASQLLPQLSPNAPDHPRELLLCAHGLPQVRALQLSFPRLTVTFRAADPVLLSGSFWLSLSTEKSVMKEGP